MYMLTFFRRKYFFSQEIFLVRKSLLFFVDIFCNFESLNNKIGKTMFVCMNLFVNVSQICHFFKSGVFQNHSSLVSHLLRNRHSIYTLFCSKLVIECKTVNH